MRTKYPNILRSYGLWSILATVPIVLLSANSCTFSLNAPDAQGVPDPETLDALFEPPTQEERDATLTQWAQRTIEANDVRIEAQQTANDGSRVVILSHLVDGFRHYGAVRIPPTGPADEGTLPMLVICHGGSSGTSVEEFPEYDAYIADESITSKVMYVLPSYRGEFLDGGALGFYQSEGPQSILDRDVDDVLSLIEAVAEQFPSADPTRTIVLGTSRGGAVALIAAVRASQGIATIAFYGSSDFYLDELRTAAVASLNGESADTPAMLAAEQIIDPLLRGDISLEAARQELLRRSPASFADRIGILQLHHGTADPLVPVVHSDRLDDVLTQSGHGAPDYVYHRYVNGPHNKFNLDGSAGHVRDLLSQYVSD